MSRLGYLLAVSLVVGVSPPSYGQEGEPRRDFLQKLDANGNGLLEPSEVSDRMRPLIDRAARHAGLDPTQPLSLERLRAGRSSGATTPGAPSSTTAPPAAAASATPPPADKKPAEPLVPGFGVATELPAVPGFGPGGEGAAGAARSDRASEDRESRRSSSDSSSSDRSEKIRRYAESMLRQYDANRNGRLEKEEWSKMRGEPHRADSNKDGIVTLEELTERLASYGRRNDDDDDDRRGSSGASPSGRASSSSVNPKRFLTPVERLPKGLPDWFSRSDLDGDGQVMMHEFATSWTESKAAEFAKYDKDQDGVITAQEALPPPSSSDRRR